MRESELLKHIYARSQDLGGATIVGPGDDAAVIDAGGGPLVWTVDQLVEGRHYDASTPLDLIARKAVARSISDIAAMASRPIAGLATGALRAGFEDADALFDAMAAWAKRWGAPLVGGDIAVVNGPTVLTVAVLGAPATARGCPLRSEARVGQGVYVTGALGGSLASGRHLRFEPRVEEAAELAKALGDRLGAMIDLSDGLGRDAGRIASASGVRIEIDGASVPRAAGVADARAAASDGEDYELLFTASGEVPERLGAEGLAVTRLGRIVEGSGCVITIGGREVDAEELGWDHQS